ncbi:MFS transporter [Mycobacteroides abscessus]|uniref:Sugar (And other) transporter family protein n=4 Tax=Mycobacteroides abscessus TaxID=36809 RepID=A0A829MC25_9MYCO|nr:MFS transporter [Mycobacteroides abscessus subsp. massiliense str. GO 06]AWG54444.1 MFS transporter [Mycobacteroides abscessus]ESV63600.1 sugar (and other) transporter family protein [Mycobacteroides abscessus MAB_091912_2446]ETZ81983.1 sugar (and other) transporter family protein [Mycobacteroides abscessus MAB_091912_2455]QCO26605.1 MFS transporter [Mycobacteroides abscessus subsp. massiliense]
MTTTSAVPAVHADAPADGCAPAARTVALSCMVGTTIEWYDFYLYATAAALVLKPLFFPSVSPTAGTLASFATYAAGFGARPVGAVIAGHLGDRVGRKAVLVGALLLMGVATAVIGALPTYSEAGVLAPAALATLRVLQGLAAGAEWGGAALLAVEHAPVGRRGLFGSFTQLGSPAGMLLATGVFGLTRALTGPEAFLAFGWRIPFLSSIVLVVVGLAIRLRLRDSVVFREVLERGEAARLPVVEVLRTQSRNVLLTTGLRLSQIALFVLLTTFSLTYLQGFFGGDSQIGLTAVLISSALGILSTPVWSALSDRVGRRPLYLFGSAVGPLALALFFLAAGSGSKVLVVLSIVFGINVVHDAMYGPQAAWFAELFDTRVRYSGASLGYQIGAVLSGGFAPLIAAALLAANHGDPRLIVCYYLALSVLTFVAAYVARETYRDQIGDSL